jgi:hypothetical protein
MLLTSEVSVRAASAGPLFRFPTVQLCLLWQSPPLFAA